MSESQSAQPKDSPTLVLMAGLAGSGKTTLALALGSHLGWPVIDKDTVKSGLLELGASEDLAGQASYTLLYDLARDLVETQAMSAILDTPSLYPRIIDISSEIVAKAGGRLRVAHCKSDIETRRQRLGLRTSRLSQPTTLDQTRETMSFAHLPASTLTLDTNDIGTEGSLKDLIEQALAYVTGGDQP